MVISTEVINIYCEEIKYHFLLSPPNNRFKMQLSGSSLSRDSFPIRNGEVEARNETSISQGLVS